MVLAAFSLVIGAEGAWVAVAPEAEQGEPQLAVKEMDRGGMDVAISLPGIERSEVEIGGEVYQQFTIPGGIETDEVGYPSLPAITRLVAIPGGGGAERSRGTRQLDRFARLRGSGHPSGGAVGDRWLCCRGPVLGPRGV
ncbi:hypothetical protein AMJ82_07500 [candidate division TA06 bacterium SM23_40]|uniref:Gingipain propeptide domain-containing protein n=1 Tax=candidate division TA06 bacterium SM23_40 TaxID=1703774 RepID=A0A0S8G6U3_UNCT6|nr:MAG: hypothetical protein AMJ82_07500 [candidate division TA06 bacterium SM23_40]